MQGMISEERLYRGMEDMAESALSVFRNERKYLVPWGKAVSMRGKFDEILSRDRHSGTSGYVVRSLYFDSINNVDYKTKLSGVEKRKKMRIRSYPPGIGTCKLELKEKYGDRQQKISLRISKEDVERLSRLDYGVLTKYFDESQAAVKIYTEMVMGGYRPVALVEYDRVAYTYPLYNTRITLDMNLRGSEGNLDLFDEEPLYTVFMQEEMVLEVKYDQRLARFISDILKQYHLTQCSVSKYCIGRKIFCDFEF